MEWPSYRAAIPLTCPAAIGGRGALKREEPPLAALRRMARDAARQRFENCLRRRALCRPTFLRSTSRASRVTSPAFDSVGLSSAS